MADFGEIKQVDIREIWPNEAEDFTPWLFENIDRLGRALGMDIEVQEREADVGDFSLDIRAKEVGTGRTIVIENQLGRTDHDHLGKLLTYAGGFDAGVLVWIAKELRDEHRKALEWLNEHTSPDIDCFGVVIEIIQIDDSKPAFNFKTVVFPNEWQKDKGRSRTTVSPRDEAYRTYFQKLIDELRDTYKFTGTKIGLPRNYYFFKSGISGIQFSNAFTKDGKIKAEVYIDLEDKDENKKLFDRLIVQKELIEKEFGDRFEWKRLDNRRASQIAIYRDGSIEAPEETREELLQWSIKNLLKLKEVVLPHVKAALP